MKPYYINSKPREKTTKGDLNNLKAQGLIPAVIYGKEENVNLVCFINDLHDLIYTNDVFLVHLKAGDKEYRAIIKEVQSNPLNDLPSHIDFMEVSDDKIIKINYPIQVVGSPIGVRQGGRLFKKLRHLQLKGKIADMPDKIEVDVSDLDIGDSLKVKDIKVPNIQILDPESTSIISVARIRIPEVVETTEAATETTPAEVKPEATPEKKTV